MLLFLPLFLLCFFLTNILNIIKTIFVINLSYAYVICFSPWFYNQVIKNIGFVSSSFDPCLYVKFVGNNLPTMVTLYVDDGLICAPKIENIDFIICHLKGSFELKVLKSGNYLGLEFKRDESKREIYLCFNKGECYD